MHVATHVHNPSGPEAEELLQERVVATLARGVDDDNGFRGGKRDLCEQRRGVRGQEGGVRDAIPGRILLGRGDGPGRDVDADRGGEEGGERDCEETGAAVGVDEKADWIGGGVGLGFAGQDVGADVGCEYGEDGVVVLEEGSGWVGEFEVVYVFGGNGVFVCDTGFPFGVGCVRIDGRIGF